MARIPWVARRPPARVAWLLGGLAVALVGLLVTAGVTSLAWGSTLREEGRLLPGTTVAGVDVGDRTVEEARAAVEQHLEPRLDRRIELVHDDQRWTTSARELGASSDAGAVLDEALGHTMDAGLTQLARMRWAGASAGPDLDVALGLPDGALDGFVATVADELDRDPRDAEVHWAGDGLEVEDGREGRRVDVEGTAEELATALEGDADTVEVLVDEPEPEITTPAAEDAADRLAPLVEEALDHTVTVTHGTTTWSTSPRRLDATPTLAPALQAALAGNGPDRVEVDVPDAALSGFVGSIAAEVDVAPRNAELELDGDEFDITPERDGRSIDREELTAELLRALRGEADEVGLTVRPMRASLTTASFDRVLVLRQDERRLYLYEDHEPVEDWPVAVGQGGSPTPTGTFTIGAKRFEPTWHNPDPDGWGSDMPRSIGPGPDNPLGVRALNWNNLHGGDTLIRFHGTPDEDSIGEAASKGCVRMYNDDVVALYDRVPSGTVILSVG